MLPLHHLVRPASDKVPQSLDHRAHPQGNNRFETVLLMSPKKNNLDEERTASETQSALSSLQMMKKNEGSIKLPNIHFVENSYHSTTRNTNRSNRKGILCWFCFVFLLNFFHLFLG